jgi:hypothetical protein
MRRRKSQLPLHPLQPSLSHPPDGFSTMKKERIAMY